MLNRKRANAYMDIYGIDAIVAANPVNVSYLTGLDCWFYRTFKEYMVEPGGSNALVPLFAVLPRDGKPILIIGKAFAICGSMLPVGDIRIYGTPADELAGNSINFSCLDPDEKTICNILASVKGQSDAFQVLCAVIQELGLERGNLCVDLDDVSAGVRVSLSRKIPCARIRNGSQIMRLIRMVKSEQEIGRLKESADINERNGIASLGLVKDGAIAGEVEQVFRVGVAREGASFEHFTFSRRGLGISSDSRRRFRKGDSIVFDFGCIRNMYFSDTATTVMVGMPSGELKRIYRSMRETIEEVIGDIVPGSKSSAVHSMICNSLRNKGVKQFSAEGHGIGLEVRDYPIIVPCANAVLADDFLKISADLTLEKGMVINLEIAFSMLGAASLGVEKTFLVTEAGCHEIIKQDRHIPIFA